MAPTFAVGTNPPPIFTALPQGEPFPIARAARIEFYTRPHLEGSTVATDDIDVMFRLVDGQGRRDGPVEGFAQDGQLTTQLEAEITRRTRTMVFMRALLRVGERTVMSADGIWRVLKTG